MRTLRGMKEAANFYKAVRTFSATRETWHDAIRYDVKPDEEYNLPLVSQRVYGNRDESLAVMAAAGLDRFDQKLTQRTIILPTHAQLEAIKQQTGFTSTAIIQS